jgi:hypothetical protein
MPVLVRVCVCVCAVAACPTSLEKKGCEINFAGSDFSHVSAISSKYGPDEVFSLGHLSRLLTSS